MSKILIVDDEAAIATLLGEVVKKLGYEPVVVQRAEDFIPAFREHKPELAIIDYMIPGVDGGQLFAALRAMTAGADIPVLFITAIPLGQLKQRIEDRAAVRFMQKPLDFAEMRRHIEEMLAERGGKPGASRTGERPA
jgi:DNA-binding response OmpR family regulator